ncbi:hypothetical protein E1B28_001995 [Marasmius oreades]|uniref:Tetraspanin Tsp2 family n=1 Tax=Marasmius oreades TaxID=181124 RepID=A0A9P7V4N4_9AGAR|nr:uncharacterized protein E1B28_001995 [Marasmius oreades]KAG7100220.1 hypothetical protein E1B28_001995 [Marasmius oreades]
MLMSPRVNDSVHELEPPRTARFVSSSAASTLSSGHGGGTQTPHSMGRAGGVRASLSVNYLPSKFSDALISPTANPRRRVGKGKGKLPKAGGGTEVFKAGEARMPVEGDEDYDGVSTGWFGGKSAKLRSGPAMKWNRFKWILLCTNTLLMMFSITALILSLLTWFNVFTSADIIRVGNRTELILSTVAASVGILTALIGYAGILLNNRSFLAIYTFMTWITFILIVIPGYLTYRKRSFNLEGKLNSQWSRDLGVEGRLRIQHHLACCGYFSPFIEATVSQTCYPRSVLPGCKLKYMNFQRMALKRWYMGVFAWIPVQLVVMVAGLLCSNHVTYRFGKGMMPKAYRLDLSSMAVIMDNYANEMTEQYGADVASNVLVASRSNLQLSGNESIMTMPYEAGGSHTVHAI